MSKYFSIELNVMADLTIEEIWPDGDAPENPTAEDVQAILDEAGTDASTDAIIKDWCLVGPWDKFVAYGPYGKDD